jgi:predicted TIM-barrel fold metal-dependent hydrolase
MSVAVAEQVKGRILDADSHEHTPAGLWPEIYGEITARYAQVFLDHQPPQAPNAFSAPLERDDAPLNAETLESAWATGSYGPSSFDMTRRVEFMDLAGIDRQLIFGGGPCLIGQVLATAPVSLIEHQLGFKADFDLHEAARLLTKAHNDVCIEVAKIDPRLRPAAQILPDSIEHAIAEAERVIDAGIRVVMMPNGTPPEGKSPAHPDLDPLWRVFTEADVPLVSHIGGGLGFLADYEGWSNAPAFVPNFDIPNEMALHPLETATMHLPAIEYLAAMILGGVFERHPTLRYGVIEHQGHWVGSFVESLEIAVDLWARRLAGQLSLRPTEYMERNVRCTTFAFEPVDRYIERYGLESVYCFGTDYPHVEGGKDPINRMTARLEHLGPDLVEKLFVTNAELLFPD